MMAPSRILTAGGREIFLGSGGSNRIRSALLRVILALLDGDARLEDAVALPRLHVEGRTLDIEGGWPEASTHALVEGPWEATVWSGANLFFGGVHAVGRGPGGWEAAGDPRREGVGLVRG
jgi:gamma-glutamyltranspeptidase / glutathione hydrolase